jgi:hypothetical protein
LSPPFQRPCQLQHWPAQMLTVLQKRVEEKEVVERVVETGFEA